MALQPLSVGDILMLSQKAWKIGRAFTQGRKSAPAEFAEVERESNGMSDALKLTAETLHSDGSILSKAEPETQGAVNAILDSAGRTLGDLESFVERYQVIKKRETSGGFVVERSWSDVVLANYKTFQWTTEGGDITELRNMLQMHTNSINLTMQALQTRSLARLERTVMPMAENVASIHDRVNGDLGHKIDDVHRIIMSVANSTPSLVARDRAVEDRPQMHSRNSSSISELDYYTGSNSQADLEVSPPPASYNLPTRQQRQRPHDSAQSTPSLKYAISPVARNRDSTLHNRSSLPETEGSRHDWGTEAGSPPEMRNSYGNGTDERTTSLAGRSPASISSPESFRREHNLPRKESMTLPTVFQSIDEDDAAPGNSRNVGAGVGRPLSYEEGSLSTSRKKTDSYGSLMGQPGLPPPAISSSPIAQQESPATPSSFFTSLSRRKKETSRPQLPAQRPKSAKGEAPHSPASSTTPAFHKSLFRNAAILCDVRGTLVEYAQNVPDEPDPRYNTEMVEACKESRICVIRKREHREHGGAKVATSIWTLSDDGLVRCQQKLPEILETVPYCSYFQPEKVSIPPTEGGEMAVKFHGEKWGDILEKEIRTNWVNYLFASENDAIAFQSAVFGRLLIGSFRTIKTTVIHEGIKGAFAFEEQFANIEMLRLWEEDGLSTPGAQGGVLALMHISSNFGEGWARWWMNSSKQQVRVKGEGDKYARLKGVDVTVVKPGSGASAADKIRSPSTAGEGLQRVETRDDASVKGYMKKIPVKKVTGVKCEFKTHEERNNFVLMSQRIQERLIPLPDI